jgi:hypothetical protein
MYGIVQFFNEVRRDNNKIDYQLEFP